MNFNFTKKNMIFVSYYLLTYNFYLLSSIDNSSTVVCKNLVHLSERYNNWAGIWNLKIAGSTFSKTLSHYVQQYNNRDIKPPFGC